MIKNILLPEKIGATRLFSQKILSFSVYNNVVRGCLVTLKSRTTSIEKLIEISLIEGTNPDSVKTPQDALKSMLTETGPVDEISLVIPATLAVIKELDIPLVDQDKIRAILDFELEPLLPFTLEEAVTDFVVTQSNKSLQSSLVTAVAMRKKDLSNILGPYEQANISINRVTIDLFATYGFYQKIPSYHNSTGCSALIDIGNHGTRISFLQQDKLKLTRYISKGITSIIEHVSEEIQSTTKDVTEHLEKKGITLTDAHLPIEKSIHKHLINFFNEIQFTLNSFSLKLNYYDGVNKIIITGINKKIPNFIMYGQELLQIPCDFFDPKKIFELSSVKNKIGNVANSISWENFITVIGAALSPIEFEQFNLRRKELAFFDEKIALKNAFACIGLFFTLLISIGIVGYSQISDLKQIVRNLESEQIVRLKKILPSKEQSRAISLTNLSKKVEDLIKEKNSLWAPFGQERTKPLEVLLEVTQTFDKKQFMLDIEELSLSEKETGNPIIELDGYFKSEKGLGYHHKEWAELEDKIRESPLLSFAELPSPIPAAEKGIKFNVKLHKKRLDVTTGA